MLDPLLALVSASPWTYAFVLAFAALDAVLPIVPAETAVIAAGALSAAGGLDLVSIIAVAAAGALIGDHASYALGRTAGPRIQRAFGAIGPARAALGWAQAQLLERGGSVLLVARFIPGGRTAATFSGGMARMPLRRFAALDVVAVLVWASFAAILGHAGGQAFQEDPTTAILVAVAVSVSLATAVELIRGRRRSGGRAQAAAR